jgi:hypothetical protein
MKKNQILLSAIACIFTACAVGNTGTVTQNVTVPPVNIQTQKGSLNVGGQGSQQAQQSSQAPTSPALFPYGSNVPCPQVSVGNGMARCQ